MNKKKISALAAVLAAAVIGTVCPMDASAYTDNRGVYHANEYSAIRSFPNANNYFHCIFGNKEDRLNIPIYRNGVSIGTMGCIFNYETIGASYGQEVTSTPTTGYYMDGYITSGGSTRYSTTRRRGFDGYYSSSTNVLSVYGSNSAIYLGSIYY